MIRKNTLASAASLAILLSSSQMYAMDDQQATLQSQERGKKKSSYQVAKGIAKIIIGSGLIAGAVYRGFKGVPVDFRIENGRPTRYVSPNPIDIFNNWLRCLNPKSTYDFEYRFGALTQLPLPIITGIISLWSGINDLMKK